MGKHLNGIIFWNNFWMKLFLVHIYYLGCVCLWVYLCIHICIYTDIDADIYIYMHAPLTFLLDWPFRDFLILLLYILLDGHHFGTWPVTTGVWEEADITGRWGLFWWLCQEGNHCIDVSWRTQQTCNNDLAWSEHTPLCWSQKSQQRRLLPLSLCPVIQLGRT